MQEVQLALMQQPTRQIHNLSALQLESISQVIRLPSQNQQKTKNNLLQFDGKLHLDLKVDKILLQIQQCKVDLAQLLEMYLPNTRNQIEIKQLKVSNLKEQSEEEIQKLRLFNIKYSAPQAITLQQNFPQQQNKILLKRQLSYEMTGVDMNSEMIQQAKQQKENQLSKPSQLLESQKISLQQLKPQIIVTPIQILSSSSEMFSKISRQLSNFKKTLMLRQAQFGMLIFLIENQGKQNLQATYKQVYQSLRKYVIPLTKIEQPINVYILEEVFQIESQYLQEYHQLVKEIKTRLQTYKVFLLQEELNNNSMIRSFTTQSSKVKLEKVLKATYKLKIINSKIITIAEIFPYACIKDRNDLFSQSKSHQRWQRLIQNDIIQYKIYGEPDKVRKSFEALKNSLNIINASMNILNQNKDLSVFNYNNWGKIFQSSSKILKIALFKNDALHQASVMIAEPDGKLAKQIWNLTQQKTLKKFVSAVLPAIDFSEKLFIPRILKSYIQAKGKQQLPQQLYIKHVTKYGNQLFEQDCYSKKIQCRINAKHRINRKYQTKTLNDMTEQGKKSSQSYSKLFFNTLSTMTKSISSLNTYFKKQVMNAPTAILHIHGGGFISMSSFIHQTYTRNWAKQLEVPILSVDYGKAPEYPFPNGLYDCLEAYMWLRFVFRQVYNTEVEKVVIVGDSAGGNLAAALTTLLIEWNLPRPEGLVLVYPALNLNFNNYTPSLIHALNDMILPHTFLKICLNAYMKDVVLNPQTDQYLSPINTCNQTLAKYPKTKIFVGGKDPFHDDCCRFVQKINNVKQGLAQLTIFDEFPHGFLQFDMSTNPNEQARKATKQVQTALRQLIYDKQN